MAAQGAQEQVFNDASDEDLLIYMSLQGSEPANARAAWETFHERHKRYVQGHCYGVLRQYLGGRYDGKTTWEMAGGHAADVLIRVYKRAETFQLRGSKDPVQMRRQVRGWMGGIAQNIIRDWLTGRGHESGDLFIDDLHEDTAADDQYPATPLHDCVGKLIDALPEKERMVVLTYMTFYNPRKEGGRLPNKEADALAKELGMTNASLRQVKRRTLQRLKEEIEAKCFGLGTG